MPPLSRRRLLLAAGALSLTATSPALANHRRYAATGAYVVRNPYARAQNDWSKPRIERLLVFGDSYSTTVGGTRTYLWGTQLVGEGSARQLVDLAVLGATAANLPINGVLRSLANQVAVWESQAPTLGSRDLVVVYLGQNDLFMLPEIGRSLADLALGIDRLIARGATSAGRRLLLMLVHDIRRNPTQAVGVGPRFLTWAPAVAALAAARPNVLMVDLTTTLDVVYGQPSLVGLTNVRTADAARSSTTALYLNGGHFGWRGHQLIAQVVRHYLTRGWDTAHKLMPYSTNARTRLREDIAAGNVFRLA